MQRHTHISRWFVVLPTLLFILLSFIPAQTYAAGIGWYQLYLYSAPVNGSCPTGFRKENIQTSIPVSPLYSASVVRERCVPNNVSNESLSRPAPITCELTPTKWAPIFTPVCWARTFSFVFGLLVVGSTAWLLSMTGLLFNYLIDSTVVDFGSLYQKIKPGVDGAWSLIRDLSNILIIGLFTFIAISIILGLKEYGQKKMIARVLIIAVLINFSLLFTKIIIDTSNYLSYQFYQASGIDPAGPQSNSTFSLNGTERYKLDGISGKFIQLMGIGSINDTYGALKIGAFGTNEKNAEDADGLRVFVFSLFAGTILLLTSAVMLYAIFHLVSRAVVLIFLMLTSSLAFASFLIPTVSSGNYGWNAWWKALFGAAIFGPMLMLFLWITLQVAYLLTQVPGVTGAKGTLGDMLTNPTNSANLSVIFSYLIILALLFASVKLSASFSAHMGGINIIGSALSGTAVAAASRLTGFAARQTIGRAGIAYGSALQKSVNARVERGGAGMTAAERWQIANSKALGKKSFDAMNTKTLNKAVTGSSGLTFGKDVGKDGLAGQRKKAAADAVHAAEELGMKPKDIEKRAKAAKEEREKELATAREAAAIEKKAHEEALKPENLATVRQNASNQQSADVQPQRGELEKQIGELTRQIATNTADQERHNANLQSFTEEMTRAEAHAASTAGTPENATAAAELTRLQGRRNVLDQEAARIRTAQESVQQALGEKQAVLHQLDESVTAVGLKAAQEAEAAARQGKIETEDYIKHLDDTVKTHGETVKENLQKGVGVQSVAQDIAMTRLSRGYGLWGNRKTDPIASKIEDAVHEHHRKSRIKEFKKVLDDEDHDDHGGTHGAGGARGAGGHGATPAAGTPAAHPPAGNPPAGGHHNP